MFVYESHLGGGLYTSYDELDYDNLYCEQCGDHDWYVGEVNSLEELEEMLEGCGYTEEEKQEFIADNWEV